MRSLLKSIRTCVQKRKNMVSYCRGLGMEVGDGTIIKPSVNISTEPYLIRIGSHCSITANVNLITHDGGCWVFRENAPHLDIIAPIVLGDNVYVGIGATILPGVTIGSNVVIGAAAVVTRDIPSDVVVAGVPARVIKTLDEYRTKCSSAAMEVKRLSYDEKKAVLLNKYGLG